jgi:hypothetical protein
MLADAFAFDIWGHLYIDLLAPTGPVQRDVPQPEDEFLRPGISWMLAGLPQMCPAVSKVLDRPLTLHLTGPGGGQWTLQPGEPHLVVAEGSSPDAAATASSAAVEFVLWGTARVPWRDVVLLEGDTAVDLAADLSFAVGEPFAAFVLDRHLPEHPGRSASSERTGLVELSDINRALGVLLACGRTREQARTELWDRAGRGVSRDLHAAAEAIINSAGLGVGPNPKLN